MAVRHLKGESDAIRDDGNGRDARGSDGRNGAWGAEKRETVVCPQLFLTDAQNLLDQIKTDMDFVEGEVTMFVMDMPNLPSQNVPVMLAQAGQAQSSDVKAMRTMGICFPAPNELYSLENVFDPANSARFYLRNYENTTVERASPTTVTILQQPSHGTLRLLTEADRGILFSDTAGPIEISDPGYVYLPQKGYVGKDKAIALVEIAGIKVKVIYYFQAIDGPRGDVNELCGTRGYRWKISSVLDAEGSSSITAIEYLSANDGDPITGAATLEALLNGGSNGDLDAANSGVSFSFADLSGLAVGESSGTSITLDTTAAGYGWYIDYTPYLNDEYLPTSNPNEWIAKEGMAAYGKMDLLSVLLHEYGHALGLEHSADSGDYMAATLQPGVRRMPSSDELALMARLVAEAKGSYDVPLPTDPASPDQPGAPLPGRSTVRTTRARISRYGTTILNADGSESQSPQDATQFAIVANPTLTDAKLQTGTGWESTGSVAIGNGAAVLSETTRSQTRLNQVFTVGPNDRYLTFTLANIGLDDVDNGPDDAFEVALLNANTGSVLTGATGLTRNDAFLNLQANGTEHLGQGVTSTRNADGSRTYRLDLAGIPVGTAVNLSFDLIGFASAGSHVTVRDIRLGVPETRDDTATTAEDNPVDIAALANDVDANQAGFTPVVVTGPAHGTVTLNADGSFRYVPLADSNGEDSFTYKLSDGSVDSNIATVRITVTPVNDAPVVASRSASTDEDTALTVDLLAGASDKVAYRHG